MTDWQTILISNDFTEFKQEGNTIKEKTHLLDKNSQGFNKSDRIVYYNGEVDKIFHAEIENINHDTSHVHIKIGSEKKIFPFEKFYTNFSKTKEYMEFKLSNN